MCRTLPSHKLPELLQGLHQEFLRISCPSKWKEEPERRIWVDSRDAEQLLTAEGGIPGGASEGLSQISISRSTLLFDHGLFRDSLKCCIVPRTRWNRVIHRSTQKEDNCRRKELPQPRRGTVSSHNGCLPLWTHFEMGPIWAVYGFSLSEAFAYTEKSKGDTSPLFRGAEPVQLQSNTQAKMQQREGWCIIMQ